MRTFDYQHLTDALLPAVLHAGRTEMHYFRAGVAVEAKEDRTPVTVADREAEAILLEALARVAPGVAVVAEEAAAAGNIPPLAAQFFLVDALDGTHLFIRGKPEFSINIGLVENGRPVFGLIYVPPTGDLYVTRFAGEAQQATILPDAAPQSHLGLDNARLATRQPDRANLVAYNSRASGGASTGFLEALDVRFARPLGSSIKFCKIAAGEGDLYARFGATSEWDTAAGDAILRAAGGCVTTVDGAPLSYGKADASYRNPHFIAWGREPLLTGFGAQ